MKCRSCGRTHGRDTLLILHVRNFRHMGTGERMRSTGARCVDYMGCMDVCRARREKQREAKAVRNAKPDDLDAHQKPLHSGRGVCRWCGEHIYRVDKWGKVVICGRRAWHEGRLVHPEAEPEPNCIREYLAQPFTFRDACWQKDDGQCQGCGRDLKAELEAWLEEKPPRRDYADGRAGYDAWYELHRAWSKREPKWAADHKVPLVDGGPNTVANGQVLCDPCHIAKTAREARERAARRRGDLIVDQTQLDVA